MINVNNQTMRTIENVLFFILLIIVGIMLFTEMDKHCGTKSGGRTRSKTKTTRNTTGKTTRNTTKDVVKDLEKNPASKFETYVRERMEKITGVKFPTVYPGWLRYKGKQLELDGYNAKLKLAFETQGPQHTRFSSKDDPRYIKYKNRVENDKAKINICKEHNVGLIVIDYKVPKHLIGSYIKSRVYDIAQEWKSQGLYEQVNALGNLMYKPGDYVEVISNPAICNFTY